LAFSFLMMAVFWSVMFHAVWHYFGPSKHDHGGR
jgi:hypothetical protein